MQPFEEVLTSLHGLKEKYLTDVSMFLEKLVVCGMLHSNCVLISDTDGPQKTQDKCQARIKKMVGDLFSAARYLHLYATDCQRRGTPV